MKFRRFLWLFTCLYLGSKPGLSLSKTVQWPLLAFPHNLDPRQPQTFEERGLSSLVHCYLFRRTGDLTWSPELASAESGWLDDTRFAVKIRDGFHFNEKVNVTLEAIYEHFLKWKAKSPGLLWQSVNSLKLEQGRLVFELSDKNAPIFALLTAPVLSPAVWSSSSYDPKGSQACGPYQIKELDLEGLALTANPLYPAPTISLPKLRFRYMRSLDEQWLAFVKGQLDLIFGMIPQEKRFDWQKNNPLYNFIDLPSETYVMVGLRRNAPALQSSEKRRRIWQTLKPSLLKNLGSLPQAWPSSATLNRSETQWLLEAASLDKVPSPLKKQGRAKKNKQNLSFRVPQEASLIALAQAIAASLKVNFPQLKILVEDQATHRQKILQGQAHLWVDRIELSPSMNFYEEDLAVLSQPFLPEGQADTFAVELRRFWTESQGSEKKPDLARLNYLVNEAGFLSLWQESFTFITKKTSTREQPWNRSDFYGLARMFSDNAR